MNPNQSIVQVDELKKKLTELKQVLAPDATDSELELFALYCQKTQLDPFSRQIHFVKRGGRAMFQTSIDGYRAIAERTGQYAGSSDPRFDEGLTQFEHIKAKRGYPTTATVSVRKIVLGQVYEISATAEWSAYCPAAGSDFMWRKMPYLMLGKVAESLALRKAFPNSFSGLYTDEEMAQAEPVKLKEEKFVQVEEGSEKGSVNLFKDFADRIGAVKDKEEMLLVIKDIEQALNAGLLTSEEADELKPLITGKRYGRTRRTT